MSKSCKFDNCSNIANSEFCSSLPGYYSKDDTYQFIYFCSNEHREKYNLKTYGKKNHQ